MITARVLHPGTAEGPVLALDEPLSFWGAFDPRTGVIIDAHHPQRGRCITGVILMMRETRGSGTAPGGMAEAIRLGTAPAAVILVAPDINLAIGALVAEALYGRSCPVLAVDAQGYAALASEPALTIATDGSIQRLDLKQAGS